MLKRAQDPSNFSVSPTSDSGFFNKEQQLGVASLMSGELALVFLTWVGKFSLKTMKSVSPVSLANLSFFGLGL